MEPFCESKMLCLTVYDDRLSSLAKDDVDNVGAGRAAKGASPASSSKKSGYPMGDRFFVCYAKSGRT